ncbi:hypothetical protein H8S20_15460 [Clostridium sp. NSJ-6]|uniref:Uncharacterized protein n=1 Tax=Clostridium hominis TaxID=2763036 RepID=A0ABR7DHC5_9CLOT|nr:hypothetical protein [Clostridium hominis]MBC5630258.1 hypothetical protein [Clostridium hominis]
MNKYISPEIEFKKINIRENIANTCWGYHSSSKELFYDYKGKGYIGFYITGSSCEFGTGKISVKYYNVPEDEQTKAYNEFYNAVIESGGDSGNPFKGEGSVILPDPDPSWS